MQPPRLMVKLWGSILLLGSLFVALVACTRSTPPQNTYNTTNRYYDSDSNASGGQAPASQQQGGADGSGAMTGVSTADQVANAHQQTMAKMANALLRVEMIIKHGKFDATDKRWSKARVDLLNAMIAGNRKLATPVRELWASNTIVWNLKRDEPCDSTLTDHGDGAAKSPRTICISLYKLTRFSFNELPQKLIQLYGHELAHLYFDDESKTAEENEAAAEHIGAFFTEITDIAFPDEARIRKTLESIDMQLVPRTRREEFQAGKNAESMCGGMMMYFHFGIILEFRAAFETPDPTVYFSPQFKEIFSAARSYMNSLHANNKTGWDKPCLADPKSYFHEAEIPAAMASFQGAIEYWKKFYPEIFTSESKPVDVEAP